VLDNSVVVAWFVESQANAYTRRARQRAEREGLLAPQLWPVEFASVLRGLERRRLLTSHNVDRVAAGAMALEIALDPAAPLPRFAASLNVHAPRESYTDSISPPISSHRQRRQRQRGDHRGFGRDDREHGHDRASIHGQRDGT
jgi:predicted nucleic acid-binding protein